MTVHTDAAGRRLALLVATSKRSHTQLRTKIDCCRADADAPVSPIVEVVQDACHLAQRWRCLSFVLGEQPENAETSA